MTAQRLLRTIGRTFVICLCLLALSVSGCKKEEEKPKAPETPEAPETPKAPETPEAQ